MSRTLIWKILLLISLITFSGVTLLPSVYKNVPDWWRNYLAPEGLRLGLDLQGGMHLVLKVDLDRAIENSLDFSAQDLKDALADKKVSVVRTASSDPHKAIFTLPNTSALDTVKEVIAGDFPNLDTKIEAEIGSFPKIILTLNDDRIDFINIHAVDQSLEIIRNRIDQFGVAEPVIIKQGTDEIVIQLPGVDPKRALNLIGQTAQLEFKLVNDTPGINLPGLIRQAEESGQWKEGDNRKNLNMILQRRLPDNTEVYFEKEVDLETGVEIKKPLLMNSPILMTGEMVKDARVRFGGNFNEAMVSLDLTDRGGKVFGQLTEKNVNRRLAIILDEVVRSAPVIRERILGGSAQISGSFTQKEAADLAIVLRVGALPAPVSIIQNLSVGASLGQDSINKGLMSGLFGTVMVLLFMMVYYKLSGVIANCALLLNLLFLFCGLAALEATLTLPGIAGIILAIGMAVDSNVLIFERMREEFAIGKTVKSGIEGGYDKALWTIIDSQVTTLITALALFLFGTGPIKGFAVTLSLGVTFNLFTTLFGTRLIYDILYDRRWLKPIKFMQLINRPNIDYMKIRNITFTFSAILVLVGLFAFAQILRGHANLGVDFSGGSLLQYKAEQPFALEDVRTVFKKNGKPGLDLQQVTNEDRLIVKFKKSEKVIGNLSDEITTILNDHMAEKQFVLESQSEIGSSVSAVLRNKAIQAIFISLLGVIIYLALRFDMRFGLAAAVATFHDVIVVLGICYLLNVEITLLIVTALLTLAGYSLNDSVVVFDRIRELMKKSGPSEKFTDTINRSINQVFSRTLVTSLTTALVVLTLFIFGGTVIHDFSFALACGLVVGTYSSVFIASPLLHILRKKES
ncbi:MAG: protein translocase subunit SecD [Thermodesulfobacteriota bacterium]|nr:protein translocase subunit SecD [Thermodesulfobacteriota bacterium]